MSVSVKMTGRELASVLSVSLGAFVVVTSEFLPIGLLTDIASGLRISSGTAGLMVTVPGMIAALTAPLITIFAARFDRRHVVLTLIALLAVSDLAAAFAPTFAVMLAARVLFGVVLGGFWTIAVTLGGRLVPKAAMARATTVILAGISIATVLGVPAGAFIAEYAGWRFAFGAAGVGALLIGAVQWALLPPLPSSEKPGLRRLTMLLSNGDAVLGLATIAFVIAGHFAAYTYVKPFLRHDAGFSPSNIGALLLVYGVAGIAGNFAGGAAAARHLRRTLYVTVAALIVSIALLPLLKESHAGVTAMIVLWGFAFGAVPIVLQLWVFKSAPDAIEAGAAMLVSTFQVFIALGSVAGGRLVDGYGMSAVMAAGALSAAGGLFLAALSRHKHTPGVAAAQPHLV